MGLSLKVLGGSKAKKALAQIEARFGRAGRVEVGFFPEATYPPRKGAKEPLYVAQVALWNENGTHDADGKQHAPPRPFMATTVKTYSRDWGRLFAAAAQMHAYDAEAALGVVGEKMKDQMVQTIVDFSTPANAPTTIKKKGFDDPLIETGHMMRSVRAKVEMNE